MGWLANIFLRGFGATVIQAVTAVLASPKVVNFLNFLGEKGFHVTITIDEAVASVSLFALLQYGMKFLKK